jgi:hypothetical protein
MISFLRSGSILPAALGGLSVVSVAIGLFTCKHERMKRMWTPTSSLVS